MSASKTWAIGGLAILAALFASDQSVQAATIPFTRSAPFFAAIGTSPTFTEGYETTPLNTILPSGTVLDGITYTFNGPPLGGRIDNFFNRFGNQSLAAKRVPGPPDPTVDFFFPGDSIVVAFATPVYGVGIFINAGTTAAVGDFFLATPVGTVGTGGPASNYDQSTFFFAGILSDTPFTTATIGSLAVGPSTGFNVDNLSIVLAVPAALLPEPAGLVLLGVGSLCLLGYGWRRRQQRA
jgi:hypothetical protein